MATAIETPTQAHAGGRRTGHVWRVLLGLAVGVAAGLAAGYLLFAADEPAVNSEVEVTDMARVEAFLDDFIDAVNNSDVDAVRALMTEDGMAFGYRADEQGGTNGLAYAVEEVFADYTYEASDVLLVHQTNSYAVNGLVDPAYDVVEKARFIDRETGAKGMNLEYYKLVTDADSQLRLHHASVLDWASLRAFGL
jgi:hypothetical protein